MRIAMVFNPVSGAGQAAAAAERMSQALRSAGHHVVLTPTQLESPRLWLDPALEGADLMVVAGGDGAVRLSAPSACRTGTPLYHLPCGTENLFAREFGMDDRSETLLRAIERNDVRRVDVGSANGRCFLLMASVGLDAEVVHDLASRRGSSISHFSYLAPVLNQLRRWRPPVLEVRVDGERVTGGEPGFLVVGNCRQYGWRLNPAGRATMDDGLLDVVFFPTAGRVQLCAWAWRCRLQRHLSHAKLVYRLGRDVSISAGEPAHYQLDGDPPGVVHELSEAAPVGAGKVNDRPPARVEDDPNEPLSLNVQVQPRRLCVLVP